MNLLKLLEGVGLQDRKEIPNISVTEIAYDSRLVTRGSLFVAIRGFATDGHRFISQAVEAGAVAVVCEEEEKPEAGNRKPDEKSVEGLFEMEIPASGLRPPASDVVMLRVKNSRRILAQLSAKFFGEPTRDLAVVGVTGTNGKTTVTYLVEAILVLAGRSPAVLGTINYRHGDTLFSATHTTPESYDLQKFIRQVKDQGADSIVMEVSSHALDLHRVDGVQFDVGVFTNLTPEHLDYHRDLEDYFRAKRRLFEELLVQSIKKDRTALLNLDDPFVARLSHELGGPRILTFSLDPRKGADLFPLSSRLSLEGLEAEVKTPWGVLKIQSPLLGAFNLSNLLAAVGAAGSLGVPTQTIETALQNFKSVPGRLERVLPSKGIHVFVDYAHTPDALKNVIRSLRELVGEHGRAPGQGRLLVVFGCGGDRDKAKRPLMGEEVAKLADWAVVTSDNPRTEDPRVIIDQILPGLVSQGWKEERDFIVEVDRARGIRRALEEARPQDIVLIAGKGHEDYQILGKTKIHFDDREVAKKILESM